MKEAKGLYIAITVITLFVLAGFFLLFSSMGSLRSDINKLELAAALRDRNEKQTPETNYGNASSSPVTTIEPDTRETEENSTSTAPTENESVQIPTAIIFETDSVGPSLPRTKITVIIENVVRYGDESIALNFKVFTDEATGHVSVDPGNIFQLVSMDENENVWQKPAETRGKFDSIPQKSSSSGAVLFAGFPGRTSIVLQAGIGDATRFFEFNFSTKTYKEVVLG